ncbi:hypothetical protein [Peptoniphilus raoultii]|uniref:hypothetical protein n=1 Tax=Peptoniphilus raoultii TaxID=1776387 RepID=UPI0008DAF80F|nr:hypothetical protein [Peptoniphilus raoultii]
MPKSKTFITILLSAFLPFALGFFYKKQDANEMIYVYLFMWTMINYLFLTTTISIFQSYRKILALPGINIRKATYYINLLLYTLIIIFVNIYFTNMLYDTGSKLIYNLSSPYILISIFVFYIINLQYGNFPIKEDGNPNIYTVLAKGSFKNGRDRYATVVGFYDKGLVVGDYYFPYETMKSIGTAKKKVGIFIKGRDEEGNYRLNIDSLNSAARAVIILEAAAERGKLDKNKLNFDK